MEIIAFYEKPWLKFDRLLKTYLMFAPRGVSSFVEAMPTWLKDKLWLQRNVRKELNFRGKIVFPDHHVSHASGAFFPSPFSNAALITMDGVGEWATASYGVGKSNHLNLIEEMHFPHSLGLLYSAFTYYCGFKVNSGEYKLMGLAPYGVPKFKRQIYDNLISVKDDGSFQLDLSFFDFCVGRTMTSEKFHHLFGRGPRAPESQIMNLDLDLAASIQQVTEEIMLTIAKHVHQITGEKNLCLSGGVALNCVSNGRLHRESPFQRLWIQPAAGDAGSALGAALWTWYNYLGNSRYAEEAGSDFQQGSFLGPSYTGSEIKQELAKFNANYKELSETEILKRACSDLQDGKVVGWFSGRMEFGPRALGARSILGDPRSAEMQSIMNLKIKFGKALGLLHQLY